MTILKKSFHPVKAAMTNNKIACIYGTLICLLITVAWHSLKHIFEENKITPLYSDSRSRHVSSTKISVDHNNQTTTPLRNTHSNIADRKSAVLSEKENLFALISKASNRSELTEARLHLANYFAKNDPRAGIDWLNSIDPAENILGLIGSFGGAVAKFHGNNWESLGSYFDEDECTAFIEGAIIHIGQTDAASAWEKTSQYKARQKDPEDFESHVLTWLVKRNPEQARDLIDLNSSIENANFFFDHAVFNDQNLAIQTLQRITDTNTRNECFDKYIRGIPESSLENFAAAYISAMNSSLSTNKNTEIAAIISRLYPDNITAAAEYVKYIDDQQIKHETTRKIIDYAESKGEKIGNRAKAILSPQ